MIPQKLHKRKRVTFFLVNKSSRDRGELQKRELVKLDSSSLSVLQLAKIVITPSSSAPLFLTCFASSSSSFLATIASFLCTNENGKKTKKVSKENCNNYTVENLFCKNFFASKFSPKLQLNQVGIKVVQCKSSLIYPITYRTTLSLCIFLENTLLLLSVVSKSRLTLFENYSKCRI